jgi:hypothetical protein
MRQRGPETLVIVVVLLGLAAIGCVAWDSWTADESLPSATDFQRLVGGLGTGTHLDLTQGIAEFDMRMQQSP